MDVSPATDTELLTAWVNGRSEPAFRTLVARYAGLVHMAARRTCGSDDLAAEVSQTVFILLAQKAKGLLSHSSLGGWLHVTAVMQAKNQLRKHQQESRKRQNLLTTMDTPAEEQAREAWQEMQPVLDGALAALSAKDREAIVFTSLPYQVNKATTLGIATAAAQKRVDRATERLRGKLARRGCQAGGSMALALVTGFATDAQAAAVLVPSLTTKAVAAGAATTALSSTLIPLALMKASTYIPAAAVLVLSAVWLSMQHQSTAALEKRNEQLAERIRKHSARQAIPVSANASAGTMRNRAVTRELPVFQNQQGASGGQKIDWQSVARLTTTAKASGLTHETDELARIVGPRINAMTKEELLAALREVSAMDAPPQTIDELENLLGHPLAYRFPEYALKELTDRLGGPGGALGLYLGDAYRGWLKKDQQAAITWMDEQVAEGKFQTHTLNGNSFLRSTFEGALITSLLATDAAAAARRIESLPPDHRQDINFGAVRPEDHAAFAELVRTHLDGKKSEAAIAAQIHQLHGGYDEISTYLDTIKATPLKQLRS